MIGIASVTLVTSASAALTYHVDSASQQIIFNGIWNGGTPSGNPTNGWSVDWGINTLSGPAYHSQANNPVSGTAFDSEGTVALLYFGSETGQNPGQGVNLLFDIIFSAHSQLPGTLTVNDLTFSYSNFDQETRNFINQLPTLQTAMTLGSGSGYGDITYATAVPEASHIGLLLGGAVSALLIRRRVKKTAQATA